MLGRGYRAGKHNGSQRAWGKEPCSQYPAPGAPVTEQGNVGSLRSGRVLYYTRQARWHHRFVLSALAQEKFCARAVLFFNFEGRGKHEDRPDERAMASLNL